MSSSVVCSNCGNLLSLDNLFGGNAEVVFKRSSMVCPMCGHLAPIRDGVYDVRAGVATYLASTLHDAATVRQLRRRLQEIQEEVDEAKIRRILSQEAPGLEARTRKLGVNDLIALLSLIVAVLTFIQPYFDQKENQDFRLTPEQFQELLNRMDRN